MNKRTLECFPVNYPQCVEKGPGFDPPVAFNGFLGGNVRPGCVPRDRGLEPAPSSHKKYPLQLK